MQALSRRDFGKLVAGVPALAALVSPRLFADGGPRIGVGTSSFRDLPRVTGKDNADEVIRAVRSIGVTTVELAFATIEPAPPSTAPFRGGTPAYPKLIVLTPEEIAATNAAYRSALRAWRRDTPLAYFEGMRQKFADAGIAIQACAIGYDETFSDEEIDTTFRQAVALGVNVISSPMTLATAARLVPFANRHHVTVAVHNQVDGNAAGAVATADLDKVLGLSQAFKLKLDIGNLTASNCDAVAELKARVSRTAYVSLKDRLRNGGGSQPFGDGDTPIADVLHMIAKAPGIPAIVEYDYAGLRSSSQELSAALAYASRSLN
jgi:sugar phosphate isomerase/epimerase